MNWLTGSHKEGNNFRIFFNNHTIYSISDEFVGYEYNNGFFRSTAVCPNLIAIEKILITSSA